MHWSCDFLNDLENRINFRRSAALQNFCELALVEIVYLGYRCWRQQRQPCGRTATFWWLGVSKLYGHILRDAIDRKSTTSLLVYGFKVGLVGLFLFSLDLCECRWYCVLLTELHFRRILLHFRENRDFSRAHQYNKVRKDDERWSISRVISTALSTVSLTL